MKFDVNVVLQKNISMFFFLLAKTTLKVRAFCQIISGITEDIVFV